MEIKLIQNNAEYESALAHVSYLLDLDPELGTTESNELDVWVTLIEKYENEQFTPDLPTPIEAIRFFMDQRGFNQNDMVQYFGSKAKASEVLNGKRDLTLAMVRKLVNGLGIPANLLIQDEMAKLDMNNVDWLAFPLKDMLKKNYFPDFKGKLSQLKEVAEEKIKAFFDDVPGAWDLSRAEMKSTAHGNNDKEVNEYALKAWQVKVVKECLSKTEVGKFDSELVNDDLLRRVARLSFLDEGPSLVEEFLAKNGIYMVVEPHLEQTYLDGAAFMLENNPIVAVTLRYDRLDNFWFTLLHELAHVSLGHVNKTDRYLFDSNLNPEDTNEKEKQANEKASLALGIDDQDLLKVSEYKDVVWLSKRYELSPSIIIGQVRRIRNDHRLFIRKMEKVRYLFGDKYK